MCVRFIAHGFAQSACSDVRSLDHSPCTCVCAHTKRAPQAACDAALASGPELGLDDALSTFALLDTLDAAYAPPESLRPVVYLAEVALLRHYACAHATWVSPAWQTGFTQLPMAAVAALLSSKSFRADSEATVLLLLAAWVQRRRAGAADGAALARLASLVRVARLPASYLESVLPHLAWFPMSRAQHGDLLAHSRDAGGMAPGQMEKLLPACAEQPGWFAPARLPPVAAPPAGRNHVLRLRWSVPWETLEACTAAFKRCARHCPHTAHVLCACLCT